MKNIFLFGSLFLGCGWESCFLLRQTSSESFPHQLHNKAMTSGCARWSWPGESKRERNICHQEGHQQWPFSRSSSCRNNPTGKSVCVCDPFRRIHMNEIVKNTEEDERRVCPSLCSVLINGGRRTFDLCFPGSVLQEQPQLFHWHSWGQERDE